MSPRIGLVLGAGGAAGCAYHAGALFSLEHHLGWDPRSADVVIGTSAGSIVGALLRAGLSTEDLVALFAGSPPTEAFRAAIEQHRAPGSALEIRSLDIVRALRPPSPRGLFEAARQRSLRPALLSMARAGRHDLSAQAVGLAELSGGRWPERDLIVVATSSPSGRRRPLTRESGLPVELAVTASCAVPGLIAPVRHRGEVLVDGGVNSTTNLDLASRDLDEIWVIAPMGGASGVTPPFNAWRGLVQRRLAREMRQLRANAGARPVVRLYTPGIEVVRTMGLDMMSDASSRAIVREAFLEVGDQVLAAG